MAEYASQCEQRYYHPRGREEVGSRLFGWPPKSPNAEGLEASASWREGAKGERLLCVAGSDELLVDPINKWVEKYRVRAMSNLALWPQQSDSALLPISYSFAGRVNCELY